MVGRESVAQGWLFRAAAAGTCERSCGVQRECQPASRDGARAATGSARWSPPSRVGGCHGGRQFARRHGRALGAYRRLGAVEGGAGSVRDCALIIQLCTHEVHCTCPPALALQRYNARLTHPVHVVTTLQLDAMAELDRPVGIGTLVTVDTIVPVDINAVATAVRDMAGRAAQRAYTPTRRGTGPWHPLSWPEVAPGLAGPKPPGRRQYRDGSPGRVARQSAPGHPNRGPGGRARRTLCG